MNPHRRALVLALLSAAALPALASAHSLEELQQDLYEREQYFQPKGEPAPSFALQDADGTPVELAELQGKVVVLYFIYAGCPDICPLHSAKISEVQEAVKRRRNEGPGAVRRRDHGSGWRHSEDDDRAW